MEILGKHPFWPLLSNQLSHSFSKPVNLVLYTWAPFPSGTILSCLWHVASCAAHHGTDLSPISHSCFRMPACGDQALWGRTLRNQQGWWAKRLHCSPGALSGMCHRRWGRWAEQTVLGTSHQVIKCPSIPSQNLMRTSIFVGSKELGSTGVRFSELL